MIDTNDAPFTLERREDGVAVLTWDLQDSSVNVFTEAGLVAFEGAVRDLIEDETVRGVVIASAKSVFHVGADLKMVSEMRRRTPEEGFRSTQRFNAVFRSMETGGKPFAAAIEGHALGGGLEMALACHARFVADDSKIQLGLPEVKLGLLPGFGGTQRLPRLLPLMEAMPLIAQGTALRPEKAERVGLVTERVARGHAVEAACAWVLANPAAKQPWDEKGFRAPSGQVHSPSGFQFFVGASGQARKATFGNYPAPRAILESVYHGLQMPLDQGVKLATRRFIELVHGEVSDAMIGTLFLGLNAANGLARKPTGHEPRRFGTVGVVGAGMMGAGIAYQASRKGVEVILLDTSSEAAEKGRSYSAGLLDKAVSRGRSSREDADAQLARIRTTTDYADLADADLVIEAVFESKTVKEDVLGKVEAAVSSSAIIATNTSTIPVTELSGYLEDPSRFIGLHFFSPVEKMPLVEIISGEATSEATLAAAFDLCKAIGKTPVDVRDGRAFFTTRVVSSYMVEGMAMLREGVAPALIDNAGRLAGMPMGPLRLADMVALDLAVKIADQTKADLGADHQEHPGIPAAKLMVDEGRTGEKAERGFYDYDGSEAYLWTGLVEMFPQSAVQPDVSTVQERLMTVQAIETLRCFDDGVLKSAIDADLGSILGWGFPPFTGGVARYVDSVGPEALLERSERLEAEVGPRFGAPDTLRKLAQNGKSLHQAA